MLPGARVWIGREDLGSFQAIQLRFCGDLGVVRMNTSSGIIWLLH